MLEKQSRQPLSGCRFYLSTFGAMSQTRRSILKTSITRDGGIVCDAVAKATHCLKDIMVDRSKLEACGLNSNCEVVDDSTLIPCMAKGINLIRYLAHQACIDTTPPAKKSRASGPFT